MSKRKLYPIPVCSADDLKLNERKLVEIDGQEIAVINVNGSIYAFRNACPHQGAPLVHGQVTGTMVPSDPRDYVYGCDQEIIRCPLHAWEFNLKTGKSVFNPDRVTIRMFEVKIEDDQVVIYHTRQPKKVQLKEFACFV